MTADKLVLIDLSSVARPIYETQIDPQRTSVEIVAKVRALASAHQHVAVCCDSRTSFRRDLDPTYKAQRPETPAVYLHELALAIETLRGDGFPVWQAEGFEADDIIASAVGRAIPDMPSLIISADKDLFQLVGVQGTEQFRPANGPTVAKTFDADAVFLRYGVHPHQMLDYLALVGDPSDNIKGAKDIGEKKAAAMLQKFGNLDDIMAAVESGSEKFTPSTLKSLVEFKPRMELVRSLLRLRTDAPIPFEEILKPRVPVDVATFGDDETQNDIEFAMPTLEREVMPSVDASMHLPLDDGNRSNVSGASVSAAEAVKTEPSSAASNGIVRHVEAAPSEWERQLEPRNWHEAKEFAELMFKSRFFSQWGTPVQAVAIVTAGRELGVPGMASLRSFHNMAGKPTLSASLMRGLVLRSGKAEYFQCIERTPTRSTWRSLRKGNPQPTELSYTIEEAKAAWVQGDAAWQKSNWVKIPADMCSARASSKLARLDYDDVLLGLYASEEFDQ
jgi:5'-3' exonuclease